MIRMNEVGTFAERFSETINRNNIRQSQLCKILEINPVNMSRFKTGKIEPTRKTLSAIVLAIMALGGEVDVLWLLTGVETK